jgi:hypothetical protein
MTPTVILIQNALAIVLFLIGAVFTGNSSFYVRMMAFATVATTSIVGLIWACNVSTEGYLAPFAGYAIFFVFISLMTINDIIGGHKKWREDRLKAFRSKYGYRATPPNPLNTLSKLVTLPANVIRWVGVFAVSIYIEGKAHAEQKAARKAAAVAATNDEAGLAEVANPDFDREPLEKVEE